MKNQIKNPFVLTKKTVYMQRIADYVRSGHVRYISGKIDIEKAGFFAAKMDYHYACYASAVDHFRQRQRGFSSSKLLFLYTDGDSKLDWILLSTEGDFLVPESGSNQWQNACDVRIQVTNYELVRQPKLKKKEVSKPESEEKSLPEKRKYEYKYNADFTWTWVYSKTRYEDLREQIIMSIRRHRTDQLRQIIVTIYRSPGFSGIRDQVKKMVKLLKSEWTRSGVGDAPELPKGLGYVRRLPDKGKLLTKIKQEHLNANRKEAESTSSNVQNSDGSR